jgi:DNA-binding response OmpR family regulator
MAVTAYAAKGDEERIRDAGAEGYVSKPISVLKFIAAVQALLEAAAERVEAEAESETDITETPKTLEAAAPEGEAAPEETPDEPHSRENGNPAPDGDEEKKLDSGTSPE